MPLPTPPHVRPPDPAVVERIRRALRDAGRPLLAAELRHALRVPEEGPEYTALVTTAVAMIELGWLAYQRPVAGGYYLPAETSEVGLS